MSTVNVNKNKKRRKMISFKEILIELNLKKKKWTVVSLGDLDKDTRHRLWDMYVSTYQSIGLHIDSFKNLTSKYKVSWVIDNDQDPQIDSFIIYKETSFGNKIALLGSDDKKENKKILLNKLFVLLKKRGWYIEASHKLADIIIKNNINVVDDIEKIKNIAGSNFIEMLSDNEYKRKLKSIGVVKKRLFGNPK